MEGGSAPEESPVPDQISITEGMVVFETVYTPIDTPLVKEARTCGATVITGDELFLRQAKRQFRIWTGVDFSINYYAKFISEVILKKKNFIKYDKSKPNGVSRKLMDISLAKNYGWEPKINLEESILKTYKSYLSEKKK